MAELPGGELLVWIALYNPASATTVSTTSSTLFIGGVSFAQTSARAKYMPSRGFVSGESCGYLRSKGRQRQRRMATLAYANGTRENAHIYENTNFASCHCLAGSLGFGICCRASQAEYWVGHNPWTGGQMERGL